MANSMLELVSEQGVSERYTDERVIRVVGRLGT